MRLLPLLLLLLIGCPASDDDDSAVADDDDATGDDDDATEDATYNFGSRFADGSSVSYSGQTMRHVLMHDLTERIGGMTQRIAEGWVPDQGEVVEELDFYYVFDSASAGGVAHNVSTDPEPLQGTYDEVSSGKDLRGKLAGNDPDGQHTDWATGFVGWPDPAVTTPDSLVQHWFGLIEGHVLARAGGIVPSAPDGEPIDTAYVTPEGQDLKQLVQKFLLGAIAFSQGADDYLDDDFPGKGLLSDNTAPEDGEAFTALEHAWDEGFGYFGAARNYAEYSDDEIAGADGREDWSDGNQDTDGDGFIDLLSEVNWGHSLNAAKRDRGAVAATDFTADAWAGFHEGRGILAASSGALTEAEMLALQAARDRALTAWENAIAATVVHYLNEVLQDMGAAGTADYSFVDHAKHWSEGKGFALALQFNRRSPLADDFAELHDLLRTAPALPDDADFDDYADDLRAARSLLGEAYGFDPANLGGDDGAGGW